MIDAIDVTVDVDMPSEQIEAVRQDLAWLDRYTDEPILGARLTLRRRAGRSRERYVADASVLTGPTAERARVLAAHVGAPSPAQATEEAVERLQRQLVVWWGPRSPSATSPTRSARRSTRCRWSPRIGPKRTSSRPRSVRSSAAARMPITRRQRSKQRPTCWTSMRSSTYSTMSARAKTSSCVRRSSTRIGLIHPRGSVWRMRRTTSWSQSPTAIPIL